MSGKTQGFVAVVGILLMFSESAFSLRCSTCKKMRSRPNGPEQIDKRNLRTTYKLPTPFCEKQEKIWCADYEDICVTEIRKSGNSGYWVTMGCSIRGEYAIGVRPYCPRFTLEQRRPEGPRRTPDGNNRRRPPQSADQPPPGPPPQENPHRSPPRQPHPIAEVHVATEAVLPPHSHADHDRGPYGTHDPRPGSDRHRDHSPTGPGHETAPPLAPEEPRRDSRPHPGPGHDRAPPTEPQTHRDHSPAESVQSDLDRKPPSPMERHREHGPREPGHEKALPPPRERHREHGPHGPGRDRVPPPSEKKPQSVEIERVKRQHAIGKVCVCDRDNCNNSTSFKYGTYITVIGIVVIFGFHPYV